jgi:hypothetical protein
MSNIKHFIEDNFTYIFATVLILLSLLTIFVMFDVNFKPVNKEIVYQKEMTFPLN